MLVVELRELAAMLQDVGVRPDLVSFALTRAKMVEEAVWKYAVVEREPWGKVFAYEVDGKWLKPIIQRYIRGEIESRSKGYGGAVIQDGMLVAPLATYTQLTDPFRCERTVPHLPPVPRLPQRDRQSVPKYAQDAPFARGKSLLRRRTGH